MACTSTSTGPNAMERRRILSKQRRRRGDQLASRMGLTLGLFAVVGTLFAGSRDWNTGVWARGQAAAPDLVGDSSLSMSPALGHDVHLRLLSSGSGETFPECKMNTSGDGMYPDATRSMGGGAAVAVQLLLMLYMFLGLAIVCDSFFEAALTRICEAMNLKDDVAGATWMAAGGSAPELATSVLGVFVSRSDVGFGTIVGSAVFNVLFVIACCAFVAPNLKLTWWPLVRDCAYYCFSMSILVFVIADLEVWWWEAVILLLLYAGYVTIMYFNERLEVWVTERVRLSEQPGNSLQTMLKNLFENPLFGLILYGIIFANAAMVIAELVDDSNREKGMDCMCVEGEPEVQGELDYSAYWYVNFAFNIFFVVEMLVKYYCYGFFGYWRIPLNCFDGSLVFLIIVEFILTSIANADGIGIGVARTLRVLRFVRAVRVLRLLRVSRAIVGNKPQVVPEGTKDRVDLEKPKPVEEPEGGDDDDDDDEPYNPFEIPDGMVGRFFWFVGFPLSLAMYLTIPDCRREMFKNWWPATFGMCIIWIGSLSFIMVWMVTEFGQRVGIRDSVMGITLLAMGTSIPDCLSSVAVARRGHGDMAVSSSIGSNIFDILIGLPIPWFLYGAVLRPVIGPEMGETFYQIQSDALAVMILSLFVMVALVITTIHISGWILSVKLGIMMMGLYVGFLTLSLLLEFDVVLGPCDINTLPIAPPP